MKKCILGLVALVPFLVNATTVKSPSTQVIIQSILNLKKVGVNISPLLDEFTDSTKEELLDIIPQQVQNADSSEIIDLRLLENDLKKSIHDTDEL